MSDEVIVVPGRATVTEITTSARAAVTVLAMPAATSTVSLTGIPGPPGPPGEPGPPGPAGSGTDEVWIGPNPPSDPNIEIWYDTDAVPTDGGGTGGGGVTDGNKGDITVAGNIWTVNAGAVTKGEVGLANVDNTADTAKPVSTAQAAALALKADRSIQIATAAPLSGGGDLTTTRVLGIDTFTATVKGAVPPPGTVTGKILTDSGTWTTPAAGGGGGSTILDGAGAPTSGLGAAGNYYLDTTNDVLYGPKATAGVTYGPEQRFTVPASPVNVITEEHGSRVQFLSAGRVTKLRYQRNVGASLTLTFNVWSDAGAKLATIADTQANVAGTFTVTLPTPVTVAAGAILRFSAGATNNPTGSGLTTVTDVGDLDWLGFYYGATLGAFIGLVSGNTHWIEPIFEKELATDVWPIAMSGGASILVGAGAPTAGVGAVNNFYIDTTGDDLYGPKTGTGFGPEQRITILGGPPNAVFAGDWSYGTRVTFTRAGRITRIRYQRTAASAATLEFRIFDNAGTNLITQINQTDAGDGTFDVLLPTPLAVTAAGTYTFAMGAHDPIPRGTGTPSVTNTVDCTHVGFYYGGSHDAWPNSGPAASATNGVGYIEPVYEPDTGAWPLALETPPNPPTVVKATQPTAADYGTTTIPVGAVWIQA